MRAPRDASGSAGASLAAARPGGGSLPERSHVRNTMYVMSERPVFSMRATRDALRMLEEEARRYRVAPRTLAETILEEGLRMRRYPGIAFVDRGGGRTAVLAAHPRLGVWQVAQSARTGSSRAAAARALAIDRSELERALAYADEYGDEIAAAVRENDEAFARVRRLHPAAAPAAAVTSPTAVRSPTAMRSPRRPRRAAAPR